MNSFPQGYIAPLVKRRTKWTEPEIASIYNAMSSQNLDTKE